MDKPIIRAEHVYKSFGQAHQGSIRGDFDYYESLGFGLYIWVYRFFGYFAILRLKRRLID